MDIKVVAAHLSYCTLIGHHRQENNKLQNRRQLSRSTKQEDVLKGLSVDSLPINPLQGKLGFSMGGGYGISQIHYETRYAELSEHLWLKGSVSLFFVCLCGYDVLCLTCNFMVCMTGILTLRAVI